MDLAIKEMGLTLIVGAFTILGFEAILYNFFQVEVTGFLQGLLKLGRHRHDDDEATLATSPASAGKSMEATPASSEAKPEPQTTHYEPIEGIPPSDAAKHQPIKHAAEKSRKTKPPAEESKPEPMKVALFIGIAFAVGMLAEDLSYKYVDTIKTPFTSLPQSVSSKLPWRASHPDFHDKESSRIDTLIKNPGGANEEVQPLATELAYNGAFSLVYPETGAKFESWIIALDDCKSKRSTDRECLKNTAIMRPSNKEIITSINGLYYPAKNWSYSVPTYYAEMAKIESRRDFSRSIFVIACLDLLVAGLLGLVKIGMVVRSGKRRLMSTMRVVSVSLVLLAIYGLSLMAYERESDEFNKRAFGYFSSKLFIEKQGLSKDKAATPGAKPLSEQNPQ